MTTQPHTSPLSVIERLRDATNRHDLDALAACFASDYRSEFPAHPDRAFSGHEQMRKNWTQIFGALPDIESVLLGCVAQGDTVWAEWEWWGTRPDGVRQMMRGVTVQGVRDDRIAWVRMYMEPVQEGGAGSDAAVRQTVTGRAPS